MTYGGFGGEGGPISKDASWILTLREAMATVSGGAQSFETWPVPGGLLLLKKESTMGEETPASLMVRPSKTGTGRKKEASYRTGAPICY